MRIGGWEDAVLSVRRFSFSRLDTRDLKPNPSRRALGGREEPPVRFRNGFYDRKAQSRPLFARGIARLKDHPGVLLRKAQPVVLHAEPAWQPADADRRGLPRVLDGVAEQVLRKPLEPVFVAPKAGRILELKGGLGGVDLVPGRLGEGREAPDRQISWVEVLPAPGEGEQ